MKIKALVSAAGVHMLQRGRIYDNYPDDVCKQYIDCKFAELVEEQRKSVDHGQTASIKQDKRGKK